MIQIPQLFEFNAAYLKFLAKQLYICQYGTFLGDCERDRVFYKSLTLSLWHHPSSQYHLNPFYDDSLKRVASLPRTAYFELSVWKDLYFEYSPYYNSIAQAFTATDDDSAVFSFTDQKDKLMRKTKEVYGMFVETLKKQMSQQKQPQLFAQDNFNNESSGGRDRKLSDFGFEIITGQ